MILLHSGVSVVDSLGTIRETPRLMKNLSPQQSAAVATVANSTHNIILSAVARAGKTSTLISMLRATNGSVAFCAFNKAISNEIATKIEPLGLSNVKVGTLHSFGFGAIRRAISRVKVDGNKLRNLAMDNFNGEYEILRPFVTSAVSMAKEVGIGAVLENDYDNWLNMLENYGIWDLLPNGYTHERGIDAAQWLLRESNQIRNIVDFSDMIYMPVLHKMKFWQYDYVMLDEAQDTNGPRRELVKMMLKPQGRLIAVGDPHQAIYAFTGANSDSLDIIKREFNAKELPLTVTFRCPKAIVKVANQWVNHIEAHESAPEGVVDSCEMGDIAKLASKSDAIICRLTKPLVEMAYSLIRQNVACRVEGRSIGEGLIKLAQRWKSAKTVGDLSIKLEEWAENEVKKHKAKGNDARCQVIEDQVMTLGVFMSESSHSDSIATLTTRIRGLFGDTKEGEVQQVLTLSTIHRSKGREWNRVFALGMSTYSPSKWAVKAWEVEQEDNLCYVQVTRAKQHLTLVNVPANVA